MTACNGGLSARCLHLVQLGLEPGDWRLMTDIGPGIAELRIRTDRAHRVFYVARFAEAIYVLHTFEKKTRKTARQDLEIGRTRLREVLRMRQERRRQD